MRRKISPFCKLSLGIFIAIFALSLFSLNGDGGLLKPVIAEASAAAIGLTEDNPGIRKAIEVQHRNSEKLMAIQGVIGHGVGVSSDGKPVIKIFVKRAGIPEIPVALEGIPTRVEVTGMVVAYIDPTTRFPRPVPIGVSTGHPDITAGTIGCRVKDASGNVYALSNNHVYANQNDAQINDNVLQPGPYDGGQDPVDAIGTLFNFVAIDFSGGNNTVDAAIALSSTDELGTSTPGISGNDGYGTPSSTIASAHAGQAVQKCGRTTGWTQGYVDTINTTVDVCYETKGLIFLRCVKEARFVDQIAITPGTFSSGGDSGSLIVTEDGNNPVGLLFAGGGDYTFANPIGLVLDSFNVNVDDGNLSGNIRPTADFIYTSDGLAVDFTDQSADSDGSVVSWSWTFGDGSTSTAQNPGHTYAADGTYTVTLMVTDNVGGTDSISQDVAVDDGINADPTANFIYSATGLTVNFTDQSSDSDGSVTAWSWDFGDGTTSTVQNPSHTYAAAGTYTVTLTVTDDREATGSFSQTVTVSGDSPTTITLTATGKKNKIWLIIDLAWSGATSNNVDIWRNGSKITTTINDGTYSDKISNSGTNTFTYKVCEENSENCSNEARVNF